MTLKQRIHQMLGVLSKKGQELEVDSFAILTVDRNNELFVIQHGMSESEFKTLCKHVLEKKPTVLQKKIGRVA